jgi:hypothetical protein
VAFMYQSDGEVCPYTPGNACYEYAHSCLFR